MTGGCAAVDDLVLPGCSLDQKKRAPRPSNRCKSSFFEAWTIIVPTILVALLLLCSYVFRRRESGWLNALAGKPLSWWVMTWFIAVALCLTVVGTFFRGPGWSWVWPWRAHAG
jgi:hypothetical protein